MFGVGLPELLVILFVILLIFGGSKLPSLAAGLGSAVQQFKKAMRDPDESNVKTIDARASAPEAVPAPSVDEASAEKKRT